MRFFERKITQSNFFTSNQFRFYLLFHDFRIHIFAVDPLATYGDLSV